ncbi:MAG: AsmA-like C-terminal domain-containing protein [Methyloceanibacter sp.]|uniref:YhdP family protein n=1 Tax=Methyloceanibacter sp. TaxID=1965321 RepID=UPI003D9AEADF
MTEPIAGALNKLSEGRKALVDLTTRGRALIKQGVPEPVQVELRKMGVRGRALVKSVPEPVHVELRKLGKRGAHVCREIFAGIVVVGLIAIVGGYGRLARGPISFPSLVPVLENAINGELTGLHVRIDDAILQRSPDGPGVLFRLRNIRLIDKEGATVAQAPLAAIGLSGSAVLSGRIAPGSVDFIGPRLLLFYESDQGLSLSFSKSTVSESEALIRGSLPPDGQNSTEIRRTPSETVIAKRGERPPDMIPSGRPFDITGTITQIFESARSGSSSYLTRFGVKNAVVVLDQNGTQTQWQVPDFAVDLNHRNRRSILVGHANLSSSKGEWGLEFRTEQLSKRQGLSFTALIEDLVPSGIAEQFPSIGLLKALDMPVTGEANVELSHSGDFIAGEAEFHLKPGQLTTPWDPDRSMQIDEGKLRVRFVKGEDRAELLPSTLKWGNSEATISGQFRPVRDANGAPTSWNFALKADDAVFGVEEVGLATIRVDEWLVAGNIAPGSSQVTISKFIIRSGTASIEFAGSMIDAPGSPEVKFAGTVSPMSLDTLKLLWPKFLAGGAREWALERVSGGQVLGGKFSLALQPGELAQIESGGEVPPGAINVELDLADMNITYIPKMPPVATKAARLSVSGTVFAVDIPSAKIGLPSGAEIALSEGRFFIPELRQDPQQGEITFKARSTTPSVLQLLDHEPLGFITAVKMRPEDFGGTANGDFTLKMPLMKELEFKDIKLNGMARLDDAVASNVGGKLSVEGGAVDVNITEQAVEAKGDIIIKGVPAQLAWQRIFYTPEEQQPPIKVMALLDEAARDKLGIKINHLVRGPLPTTLSMTNNAQGEQTISMQADLTSAELIFGSMGWTKAKGRAASVQFDVAQTEDGSTELKNFRMLGDQMTIDGWIALDPEQHLKSLYFSDFSFDAQTHIEISATVRDDQVLAITAQGPSYNGKLFFQSLFSAGQLADTAVESPDPFDIDLTARVNSLVGSYNTTVANAVVTLKKRKGRLVALNATGELNGKAPAAAKIEDHKGSRLITAESRDAGAAFRLVGFYPNVEGGEASLQVNLDAGGPGEKTGILWARSFTVLGDSVVSNVLSDPNATAALGEQATQANKSRIAFDKLRAPFSVGGGQFRLKDAYMNGPALGATMRGTVDFKSQTVDLGGTYVPLYGLNSALGAIPILGKVLVGRPGEGIVGITFAIKGKLDDPAVLVNPMSVMTPGIFRQIFEFSGGAIPEQTPSATGFENTPR